MMEWKSIPSEYIGERHRNHEESDDFCGASFLFFHSFLYRK